MFRHFNFAFILLSLLALSLSVKAQSGKKFEPVLDEPKIQQRMNLAKEHVDLKFLQDDDQYDEMQDDEMQDEQNDELQDDEMQDDEMQDEQQDEQDDEQLADELQDDEQFF